MVEEFKGNFDCFGENTEKYINFSVPIKKELDNNKACIYQLKFIDSFRSMSPSISSLLDNLSEINKKESINEFMLASLSSLENDLSEINKKESINEFIDNFRLMLAELSSHTDNLSEINKKESDVSRKESTNGLINNFRIIITTLSSHIDNLSEINKKESEINKKELVNKLIEKFPTTYQFCNKDLDKFLLLLRKGVYPYEYMDNWKRFNETKVPPKESIYSELNLEDITDKDYTHAQKVWNTFNIKNLGEYHDLYVQSDTLLIADVFENFRDECINTYELDPAHFLSATGLSWEACLKKTNVKLELLTDYDKLMMEEKGITGGICQSIHRYAEANNKYMKNYNKSKK